MHNLLGRWDLTVGIGGDTYPSWVEFTPKGGQFVGRFGSARPLAKVEYYPDGVKFRLPPQYENRKTDLEFVGALRAEKLIGTTVLDDGRPGNWSGFSAPELPYYQPSWREPVELIGEDMSNWSLRSPEGIGHWSIQDEMLVNSDSGSDLVSVRKFGDFKLIAEYRYPEGSNSGIYLRGRYEVQILDDYASGGNTVQNSGAIYGFLAPAKNTIQPPGEWNTAEITLIGRFVTIVLNGETIIDCKEIPGITGGALDCNEGVAGPFFLQGDHGPVTFRRLTVTPGLQL